MQQNQGNITKRVNHTPNFLRAAEQDKTGALAYLLYAAFGVSLSELIAITKKMVQDQDENLAHMAITASLQIRNNVVFVGNDFGGLRQLYPALIIEGERPQQDIFNFSALHCLGHLLCHLSSTPIARKILNKAGSAITGQGVTESVAGRINRELSEGWSMEDKLEFNNYSGTLPAAERQLIDNVFTGLRAKADAFRTTMAAQGAPMQGIVVGGGAGAVPMGQVVQQPPAQAAQAQAQAQPPQRVQQPGRQPPAPGGQP